MKVIQSSVCRVKLSEEVLALATGPGKFEIPVALLAPRQIKIRPDSGQFNAKLVWHRDAYVPVIHSQVAEAMVFAGQAEYCKQYLLVYALADYLEDSDVIANPVEFKRVSDSGAELVAVAVIGDNRSALSVCRNIVSGCSVAHPIEAAKGAIEASSIFLIEDHV